MTEYTATAAICDGAQALIAFERTRLHSLMQLMHVGARQELARLLSLRWTHATQAVKAAVQYNMPSFRLQAIYFTQNKAVQVMHMREHSSTQVQGYLTCVQCLRVIQPGSRRRAKEQMMDRQHY